MVIVCDPIFGGKTMENPKIKFYADKKSFWAHSASVLLVLAIVFQIIGSWGLWTAT